MLTMPWTKRATAHALTTDARQQNPVSVPLTLRLFWEGFQASSGKGDLSAHFYEAFHFDDNESRVDQLS